MPKGGHLLIETTIKKHLTPGGYKRRCFMIRRVLELSVSLAQTVIWERAVKVSLVASLTNRK